MLNGFYASALPMLVVYENFSILKGLIASINVVVGVSSDFCDDRGLAIDC
jgi:hypothetical protein